MLKIQEIREIIKLIDQSTIDEFVYEHEGSKIQMKKNLPVEVVSKPIPDVAVMERQQQVAAAAVQAVPKAPVQAEEKSEDVSNLHTITSPMVGTFYQSSSPEVEAYVKTGSKVTKDSVVCIVEAMKLFNEIEAEVEGEIVEILVKDGQLVEYGQPLFLVKPE
ncbi:acetyl-CoA carboxylase biotin carboxyl carrier protein [Bacillus sp. 03113]|uniref:acetyl-CoA carboxylase biotin carboxyl carrier protein n=1 Tax=Bacillus sp. 03113 TaxID=2578211 RepID=UPI001141ECDD|nr:acetyl-CoA carboxylase biotin carboxyl carrier protein [Bacillus sp. 03113]